MSKSQAQIYQDQEYEQFQSNINLFNTNKCIKEKKIRKFKLHKNPKNNYITTNMLLLYQSETTTNQQSKASQSNRKTILSKKKETSNCFHEFPNNNNGVLQQKMNKQSFDIRSHFVEIQNGTDKQIFLPLSPIKEIEEYVLCQSKLKQVRINNQQYCQDNLKLIVLKIEKQHKIKIEYYIQQNQTRPN